MEVSKAAEDILNNPRFEGAIDTIKGVTEWTDVGFATVITFVAFMIICVAMLKNVLAGAYCAYPKFWDHVNEAHKNKQGRGLIQQTVSMFQGGLQGVQGGAAAGGQSVGDIIYGIIPDVKHMTDFEEGEFSAKHYFMKAIPQMLVCVALGAFIYNGTYRDVAALWVNTGTTLINRTLLEFDPIAMFDDFTSTSGRPVFGTDNAIDQYTQTQNKIATDMYTAIIGTYKDIKTAEQKRLLADTCDTEAKRLMESLYGLGWGPDVVSAVTVTTPSPFSSKHQSSWSSKNMQDDCEARTGLAGENPKRYQFAACSSLESMAISSISSESHPEHMFIVHVLTFTEGTPDAMSGSCKDLVLSIAKDKDAAKKMPLSNSPVNDVYFDFNSSNKVFGTTVDGHTVIAEQVPGGYALFVDTGGEATQDEYELTNYITVTVRHGDVTERHQIVAVKTTGSEVGVCTSESGYNFNSKGATQTYADFIKGKPVGGENSDTGDTSADTSAGN